MKRLSILSLLMFLVVAVSAQTRSVEEAKNEVLAFLHESANSRHKAKAAVSMALDLRYTLQRPDESAAAAYLFQVGDDSGYVLVSAEKSARTILAYADEGSFDERNIPTNMKIWLQHYAEEIAWASKQSSLAGDAPRGGAKTMPNGRIEPLLGDIEWNQGAPYWNNCPYDSDGGRCYTGCVATATAQIMRYWKTPVTGKDSHYYVWQRSDGSQQQLSANFSQHTYDWDSMIGNYNHSYTEEQAQAVAVLMSDVGIAIDMAYSSSGSGTQTELAAQALYKYFGFKSSLRAVHPDYVGNEVFAEQMLAELQDGRPVLMSGATTSNEGHAFVCDGYDGEGLFHINWGWGGIQNNYFALSALDPAEQGMGGAASGKGYSVRVLGVMGIEPGDGGEKQAVRLGTLKMELASDPVTTRGATLRVLTTQIKNIGLENWGGGLFGYAVLDEQRNFLGWATKVILPELHIGSYYPDVYEFSGDLACVRENGQYTLTPVFTNANFTELWIVDVGYGTLQEFTFTVTGDNVVFTEYVQETLPDYSIRNLQAWAEGSTVNFSFESDAPNFHVKIFSEFNEDNPLDEAIIDSKSAYVEGMPDGEWTIWVRPVDAAKEHYLGDAATTTVVVGMPLHGTVNFMAVNEDGYWATFSSDEDVIFDASDVSVYTVAVDNNALMVVDADNSSKACVTDKSKDNGMVTGYYVQAGAAVLLNSRETSVNYYFVDDNAANELKEISTDLTSNMLLPTTENGQFKPAADGNFYYKLAYGDNTCKSDLGFWWGAVDGSGMFNVKAGGAVLCVPQASASNLLGFRFGDDVQTVIKSIDNHAETGKIYNLHGQRVRHESMSNGAGRVQQGVNIYNGKKVLR